MAGPCRATIFNVHRERRSGIRYDAHPWRATDDKGARRRLRNHVTKTYFYNETRTETPIGNCNEVRSSLISRAHIYIRRAHRGYPTGAGSAASSPPPSP